MILHSPRTHFMLIFIQKWIFFHNFRLPSVDEQDNTANKTTNINTNINTTNCNDVLEVPGIPNTTLTPSSATSSVASSSNYHHQHALGSTSSARSSASSECVWDSAFHGVVIALNRKTVSVIVFVTEQHFEFLHTFIVCRHCSILDSQLCIRINTKPYDSLPLYLKSIAVRSDH